MKFSHFNAVINVKTGHKINSNIMYIQQQIWFSQVICLLAQKKYDDIWNKGYDRPPQSQLKLTKHLTFIILLGWFGSDISGP